MKVIELNRPAVAKAIHNSDLSVKVYLTTYRYLDSKGVIQVATQKAPVYRYAKRYESKDKKYSVIMVSKEKDTKKIESFFDELSEQAANVRIDASGFTYLDNKYGDKK